MPVTNLAKAHFTNALMSQSSQQRWGPEIQRLFPILRSSNTKSTKQPCRNIRNFKFQIRMLVRTHHPICHFEDLDIHQWKAMIHFWSMLRFDGMVKPFNKFQFGVDFNIKAKARLDKKLSGGRRELLRKSIGKGFDPAHMMFLLDSVTTITKDNNIVTMYHDDSSMDSPASKLVEFDSQFGSMLYNSEINNLEGKPINAVMAKESGLFYTFSVVPNGDITKGKNTFLQ